VKTRDFILQAGTVVGGSLLKVTPTAERAELHHSATPEIDFAIQGAASNLGPLHSLMLNLCGKTAMGIGVSRQWLAGFLQRQLNVINSTPPYATPLGKLSVQLTVTTFAMKQGAQLDELDITLVLNITPSADATKSFRTWTLSVQGVQMKLAEDPNLRSELTFSAVKPIPPPSQTPNNPTPDSALVQQYYAGDVNAYLKDEYYIILFGWEPLISGFVQTIPFPRITTSQLAIRMLPPLQVAYDTDYLIIYSQNVSVVPPNCPPTVGAQAQFAPGATITQLPAKTGASFSAKKVLTTKPSPFATCSTILNGNADLFMYLPRELTLLQYMAAVFKPAVALNDSGYFALIRWYYDLAAALNSASLTLTFVPSLAINAAAQFHLFGDTGASVVIGCIEYANVGVTLDSGPDYGATATMTPCVDNGVLFLDAQILFQVGQLHFGSKIAPLDVVMNLIFGKVTNKYAEKLLNSAVSAFKVQLLDLTKLFDNLSTLRSEGQVLQESGIFGMQFERNESPASSTIRSR
jgi:hypothetical protein